MSMRINPDLLAFAAILPEEAERLMAAGAGQCWGSAAEMADSSCGDHPHGFVDECGDEESGRFFRIWHDPEAVWLNTYAS